MFEYPLLYLQLQEIVKLVSRANWNEKFYNNIVEVNNDHSCSEVKYDTDSLFLGQVSVKNNQNYDE